MRNWYLVRWGAERGRAGLYIGGGRRLGGVSNSVEGVGDFRLRKGSEEAAEVM